MLQFTKHPRSSIYRIGWVYDTSRMVLSGDYAMLLVTDFDRFEDISTIGYDRRLCRLRSEF